MPRWIEALLGPLGLVVYESSDPATKPLVADLFAREITMAGASARRAIEAGAALEAAGYHAQVTPAEGSLALFRLHGRARADPRGRQRPPSSARPASR